METKAFITGSHAYGSPTKDSDVDVVLYCDKKTLTKLVELFGDGPTNYKGTVKTIKSGKLNLMLCHNISEFEGWEKGTEVLKCVAPVNKEKATKVLDHFRGHMFDR